MKAYVDMDGLLVDFINGFCKHHNIQNPYENPNFHGRLDFIEIASLVKPWESTGKSFWANLEPTSDAFEILYLIERKFDDVRIVTKPCPNHGCYAGKMLWIEKYLERYVDRVTFTKERGEVCANPNTILFDDDHSNTDSFILNDGDAVLIPRLWNRYHKQSENVLPYLANILR